MAPGEMLCFGHPELEAYRLPLAELIAKDLLVAESFHGGYSLTKAGFAAMKGGVPSWPRQARGRESK
jgi:hypothetical protein